MKRFSEKAFIKSGILDKLHNIKFTKNNNIYTFDSWYYNKKFYYFIFCNNDKNIMVTLYGQHLNDYKNTIDLIKTTLRVSNYNIIE